MHDSICKCVLDIWPVFNSRQSTNVFTNKFRSQKFLQSHLQAAFSKFYGGKNNLACPYNLHLSHMLSGVFHIKFKPFWNTDLDHLPNLEMGLTRGCKNRSTGNMLFPLEHLICLPILWFAFLTELIMGLITVRYLCHFIINVENFYI
jgi:hypothetical protein